MKNALAALRHYLADYAEVNVLCDGRVYTGDSIPLDDTEKRRNQFVNKLDDFLHGWALGRGFVATSLAMAAYSACSC